MVLSTLIVYLALYVVLLAAYIVALFHLAGKAAKGQPLPPDPRTAAEPNFSRRSRPMFNDPRSGCRLSLPG